MAAANVIRLAFDSVYLSSNQEINGIIKKIASTIQALINKWIIFRKEHLCGRKIERHCTKKGALSIAINSDGSSVRLRFRLLKDTRINYFRDNSDTDWKTVMSSMTEMMKI